MISSPLATLRLSGTGGAASWIVAKALGFGTLEERARRRLASESNELSSAVLFLGAGPASSELRAFGALACPFGMAVAGLADDMMSPINIVPDD